MVMACLLAVLMCAMRTIAAGDLPAALRTLEDRCESRRAALKDLTIVTDFVIHSPNGDIPSTHTIRQKGNKVRMDVEKAGSDYPRLDFVGVTDDKGSWTLSGAGQSKRQGSAYNQQDPNFVCWQFTPETSKVTGEEVVRDRDCYIVEVQVRGTTNRLWVDRENLTILQHDEVAPSGTVTRWVASAFHTVTGDLKIPQKTEMYIGDHLMATVIVQSVTFNTGLSDDLFDPDKVTLDPVGQ